MYCRWKISQHLSLSAEAEDIDGVRRIGGGGIGFPRWDELLCRLGTTPSRFGTNPEIGGEVSKYYYYSAGTH